MSKRLTRIYTRNGDEGRTRLGEGTEVDKNHPRVKSMGDVDELNSLIGLVLCEEPATHVADMLEQIQHTLFDVGGELCMPGEQFIKEDDVTCLENWIDTLNEELGPLEEFILPGGSRGASYCHLARSVCRRAERQLFDIPEEENIAPTLKAYINRLSDFLFVAARKLNRDACEKEVYWKAEKRRPGGNA